ncbi:hypothetical protein E3N88_39113 [Mikania micrantha]|uniref:non-specific serine/threonine protein kinase n=1 Tax=Mikania micrantha TaxID=192012 RepID=A0A5N6LVW0_9ASTR|nr:hypothetical protein E3N88_39113 [Mikania micrantha]
MVILATVIHFAILQCQETQPYDICRQVVHCGAIDFKYPFWGLNRPKYCGHPGFQLTCHANVTLLVLESVSYRVLNIDTSTHTVTIARNDMWSTLCPQYLHNTTYDSTLFNNNNFGQQNASLYYTCPGNIQLCHLNGTRSHHYFYHTGSIADVSNMLVQCGNYITLPVDRSADRFASVNASTGDLRSAFTASFNLQWMAYNDECDTCIQSNGHCGSNSTSPELFACYCAAGSFSSICSITNESGGGSKGANLKLIIGSLFAVFVLLCRKSRLRSTPKGREAANDQIELFTRNYGSLAPKRYKYSKIKKITNSFQDKLGQGGYGSVYKGQLSDGHLVAVKLLSETTGDGEDFINEIESISRTSHVNIVTLLGFCIEGTKRALIYEFVPNGSLDKFLCCDDSHLNWNTLFQIAKGIARGLESLGGASHKSDVYSYGMLVLEMIGTRKHNKVSTSEAFFPDWIYKQVEVGSDLKEYGVKTEGEVELARKMMMVGLWCIQYHPSDRPSIDKVVEMLEGSFESLQVPPRRFWASPTSSNQCISHLETWNSVSEK